jgi:transcriptional regulator with XRE-family HTH domain/tetratricopeptide (TPR) repeat protein
MNLFGPELRRRRKLREISLSALASKAGYSKGYLSRIENNQQPATVDVVLAYDQHLEANGELLALLRAENAKSRQPVHRSAIPAPTRHFVGRESELDTVVTALAAHDDPRPCVINGLAGVGKTELAFTAAHHAKANFPDGCLYADLQGYGPGKPLAPADTAHRLLRQLDVDVEQIPADPDERTRMARDVLGGRRVLIVLDNARTTSQVVALVPTGSACRVIVTSRDRLAAMDEAVRVPLGMLADSDAVELFRAVAGDNASVGYQAAVDLVRHCDGLPLAIRIAASQFATGGWSMTRFLALLDREATLLSALDDGERSVAAAFRVSYQCLTRVQRKQFALLTIHPAGPIAAWLVDAVAAVDGGRPDEALDRLHDAHLITRDKHGDIGMHDLVRAYAVRYAAPELTADERRTATSRLIDLALGAAVAADQLLEPHRFRPLGQTDVPDRLPFTNAVQALAWLRAWWPMLTNVAELAAGDPRSWQLAFVLRAFFFRERLYEPWLSTHQTALATTMASGDRVAQAMILNGLGMAYVEKGDLIEAVDAHSQARETYAEAGDRRGEIDALSSLAWVRLYQGKAEDAAQDLDVALAYYRTAGHTRSAVIALRGLAMASALLDRHEAAVDYAREATDRAQLPLDAAMGTNCLAWANFRADRLDDAARHYTEGIDHAEQAGSQYERTRALIGLGNVEAARGRAEQAAELWQRADDMDVFVNPATVAEASTRRELAV